MLITKAAYALCSIALASGIAIAAVDSQSGNVDVISPQQIAPTDTDTDIPDCPTSVASLP